MKIKLNRYSRTVLLAITLLAIASTAWCQPDQSLELYAKGIENKRIYVNQYLNHLGWSGWAEVPGGGVTNHALASALFNETLYLFAIGLDNQVWINAKKPCEGWGGWSKLPGSLSTDAPVAPVVFGSKLFVFLKDLNNHIRVSSTSDGKSWSGWSQLTGTTDVAVATAVFSHTPCDLSSFRLYLFAKGVGDKKVYMASSPDGSSWSGWAEVPGGGTTDAALAASTNSTGYCGLFGGPSTMTETLYLFAKGIVDQHVYFNKSGDGKSWNGWSPLGGLTDVSPAVAKGDLVVFAKGSIDHRVYLKYSTNGQSWSNWFEVPPGGATTDVPLAVGMPPVCIK